MALISILSLLVLVPICTAGSSSSSEELEVYSRLNRQIQPRPDLGECIDLVKVTFSITLTKEWLAAMFQGGLDCSGLDRVDLLGLLTKLLVNLLFTVGCNAALAAIPGAVVLAPVLCV